MVLQIDCGLLLATHNYEVNFFWRERQGDTFLTEVKETNVLCQQEDFALFCNVKIPEGIDTLKLTIDCTSIWL